MGKAVDLTNRRFDRLLVIERAPKPPFTNYTGAWWTCQCDCGRTTTLTAQALVTRNTRSCGCLNRELVAERNRKRKKGNNNGD